MKRAGTGSPSESGAAVYVVEVEGMDVYDPVSNAPYPSDRTRIATWLVDTDYDGRTCCICQAFFRDKAKWDKSVRALGNAGDVERAPSRPGADSAASLGGHAEEAGTEDFGSLFRGLAGSGTVSFKVLVIAEDPTNNGYILTPLAKALVSDAGRPAAAVKLVTNPRVRGHDQAVQAIRHELADRYAMQDLWLFFPDADRAKPDAMRRLEEDLAGRGITLFCCIAQPEVEIFACVPFREDIIETWDSVRAHRRMKEEISQPLLGKHGAREQAGGGRKSMIRESLQNLPLVFQLCPETKALRDRIAAHLRERGSAG